MCNFLWTGKGILEFVLDCRDIWLSLLVASILSNVMYFFFNHSAYGQAYISYLSIMINLLLLFIKHLLFIRQLIHPTSWLNYLPQSLLAFRTEPLIFPSAAYSYILEFWMKYAFYEVYQLKLYWCYSPESLSRWYASPCCCLFSSRGSTIIFEQIMNIIARIYVNDMTKSLLTPWNSNGLLLGDW